MRDLNFRLPSEHRVEAVARGAFPLLEPQMQHHKIRKGWLPRKSLTGAAIALGVLAASATPATFGALAISPGLNGTWPGIAWLGPRLASQGFVVFGIETNNLNDSPTSRGTQLLAALDYLTQQSSVRNRVDASRLAVAGHSMGGGGALDAALRRLSLKTTIGNAPYLPSGNLAGDRVPTLIYAMQNDTLVTPARLTTMYNTIPTTTERAYIEVAAAGHNYIGQPSTTLARTMIPWLKIFLDNDTRYSQFLCPLADRNGISQYRDSCPLISTTTQKSAVGVR